MRVLHVITRAVPAGAQTHVVTLIEGMPPKTDIAIVVGEEGYLTERSRQAGAEVFIVPELIRSMRPDVNLRAVMAIRKIIKRWRPTLLHAHCLNAGLCGRIAARWSRCPSVYTVHGWQWADGTPFARRMLALATEWVGAMVGDQIITVCNYDSNLAQKLPLRRNARRTLIYNGINDYPSVSDRTGDKKSVVITMVARFMAQKDHSLLIRACSGLDSEWRLRLIGDGETRQFVEAEVCRLGLEDRVEFLGNRSDVAELLDETDILALTSHYEGLPMSILEAMRASLPVIATNVGGIADCVEHGRTGFLVPRGNVEILRAALAELISSNELRKSMGKEGRRRFEMNFRAGAMVQKTVMIYESLIAD